MVLQQQGLALLLEAARPATSSSFLKPSCELVRHPAGQGSTYPEATLGSRTLSGPPFRQGHVALAGSWAQRSPSVCALNTDRPFSALFLPAGI